MNKKYNFVYITTNLKNGKQYIGSHSTDIINDGYLGSGRYFLKTVKKEGKENFKREIIKKCDSILEARNLEAINIEKYNTLYPYGYNLSPKGGLGFNGAILSEETKQKISKANKGKIRTLEMRKNISEAGKGKNGWTGKHHTKESKEKISKSLKNKMSGEKHHYYGKHRSEETKQKISDSLKGRKIPDNTRQKLKEASLNVKKIKCPHCQKYFTPWGFKNHQKTIR
jgi:hypothetical protein